MTMIWGISPLLGFLLSPLIGSISDRCRSPFGRRRPIIIVLAIGIMCGLVLLPHCIQIGHLLGDPEFDSSRSTYATAYNDESGEHFGSGFQYKWALLVTIIGIILLDFNADICQSPARAYILDVSIAEDHSKGLSAFGIMCGIGSFCGFVICSIDWSTFSVGQFLGGNVATVFGVCTIALVICLLFTITSFREIPLSLLETDELLRPVTQCAVRHEHDRRKALATIGPLNILRSQLDSTDNNNGLAVVSIENDIVVGSKVEDVDSDGEEEEEEAHHEHVTLLMYLKSVIIMPKSIRILCLTHLFTKMAILSYSLYFTDFVGEVIFNGDPKAPFGSEEHQLYEEGVRFGCCGLAAFALACTFYSMVIDKLIKTLG